MEVVSSDGRNYDFLFHSRSLRLLGFAFTLHFLLLLYDTMDWLGD